MTDTDRILVVDDEKNIRTTLALALGDLAEVDTAVNGDEALRMLGELEYRLVLLDLKMPGMDGMQVLHRMAETRPEIRFVIVTAHGNVDNAVEAMKAGAADFIQKPFTADEIRDLVQRMLDREALDHEAMMEYGSCIELAKRHIGDRHFDAAREVLHKASSLFHDRPEVFNLLGAIHEIQGDRKEAVRNYRAGYWISPSYAPVRENLERITGTDADEQGIRLDGQKLEEDA